MSNTIGNALKLTLFGESHGPYIGGVLDGLAAGIRIDEGEIAKLLEMRKPSLLIDTGRKEEDSFHVISGVFKGFSTGEPICIMIPNNNMRSEDYIQELLRPGHVDYVAKVKSNGYNDYRGGGHFSGRLTAVIVAFGAIILKALENKNIKIGTHILACGEVLDHKFENFEQEIEKVNAKKIPVINEIEKAIEEEILKAKNNEDSVGGILETAIIGLPIGIGRPWFNSLEGVISSAMFAIGGIKGIEFGLGFEFAKHFGSEVNDQYRMENGKIVTLSNNNGGINGGLSNGNPLTFNVVVKPTASIAKTQQTVDVLKMENAELNLKGRHDPAIVRRAAVVVRALSALVIADELILEYGKNYLK